MGLKSDRFSAKSRIVLNYIAEGHSYEQILRIHPNLTFKDIFLAAQEALEIIKKDDKGTFIPDTHKGFPNHVERIRKSHARAYELWTKKEEALLTSMFVGGAPIHAISLALKRQPGAIRSRIRRLGLARNDD